MHHWFKRFITSAMFVLMEEVLSLSRCSRVQAATLSQALCHQEKMSYEDMQNEDFEIKVDDVWGERRSSDANLSLNDDSESKSIEEVLSSIIIPEDANSVLVTDEVLIGKVVKKGPVEYYGDVKSNQVLPVQFQVVLADQTRSVKVSFWNSLCTKHFTSLSPGLVVGVRCFRFKRNGEVSLNSNKNPEKASKLDVFTLNDHAIERLMVPVINTIFTASSVMDNASYRLSTKVQMEDHCSCLGIITYLGRYA